MRCLLHILFLLLSGVLWAAPVNDLCTGATTTTPDGSCYTGTTSGAADNITGEAGCATQGGPNGHRDIWYSFTATTTTVQFNITSPSGSTIELLLLSGTCGSLVLENSTCQTSPLVTTFAGLTVGQTYYYVLSFPSSVQSTVTSCVTSIASPPEAGQNCLTASPICSNSSFGGNSDGYGTQELTNSNHGCLLSNERQSSWYYFQIQTSGTLDMTIDPVNSVDYDFALWGPMASYSCPVTGTPIRCSYASGVSTLLATGSYNTGFGPTGTEASDGTSGTLDGWASSLNVLAGEFYILVIDNFAVDNSPFNLSWGGSTVLSCAILLPVELSDFYGQKKETYNEINWITSSENQNAFFTLERSADGVEFKEIYLVNGAGNSNNTLNYFFKDYQYQRSAINYYRLKQTDTNGDWKYSDVISIDNHQNANIIRENAYDLTGRKYDVNDLPLGLFVIVTEYSDGTMATHKTWKR
jgi:hypothetical protein